MTPERAPESMHQPSLVPPHRRARVAFAFLIFSLGLCLLSYVSTL